MMSNITSEQYVKGQGGVTTSITVVSNGKTYSVPIDINNTDYQSIQEWVAEGNTITPAS